MPNSAAPGSHQLPQEAAFAAHHPELASLAMAQIRERRAEVDALRARTRRAERNYEETMRWMREHGWELPF